MRQSRIGVVLWLICAFAACSKPASPGILPPESGKTEKPTQDQQSAGKPTPDKQSAEDSILAGWNAAGAEDGWMFVGVDGGLVFHVGNTKRSGQVRAFYFRKFPSGIGDLPVPSFEFGITFSGPGGAAKIGDENLKTLSRFRHIVLLNLWNTDISDAGLKHLASLPDLRGLDVGGNRITDAGAAEIGQFKTLKCLSVGSTIVSDAGLKSLSSIEGLECLDVSFCKITDAGLKDVAQLKKLHTLDLSNCRQITDAGIAEFRKASSSLRVIR